MLPPVFLPSTKRLLCGGGAWSARAGAELRTHPSVPAGWLEMGTADPGPQICHLLYCLSACWESCPGVADRAVSMCCNTVLLPRLLLLRRARRGATAWSEGDASPSFIPSKGAGLLRLPLQFPVSNGPWKVYLLAPVGIRSPYGTLCTPCAAEVGTMGVYSSITPQHPPRGGPQCIPFFQCQLVQSCKYP